LARTSKAAEPSPQQTGVKERGQSENHDVEDEIILQPPRFSMPIEEDDSFDLAPPRLSMPLEDMDNTAISVETGRQAENRSLLRRRSRGSLGSIRASDRFNKESELGLDANSHSGVESDNGLPELDEEDALGDLTRRIENRRVVIVC